MQKRPFNTALQERPITLGINLITLAFLVPYIVQWLLSLRRRDQAMAPSQVEQTI